MCMVEAANVRSLFTQLPSYPASTRSDLGFCPSDQIPPYPSLFSFSIFCTKHYLNLDEKESFPFSFLLVFSDPLIWASIHFALHSMVYVINDKRLGQSGFDFPSSFP